MSWGGTKGALEDEYSPRKKLEQAKEAESGLHNIQSEFEGRGNGFLLNVLRIYNMDIAAIKFLD